MLAAERFLDPKCAGHATHRGDRDDTKLASSARHDARPGQRRLRQPAGARRGSRARDRISRADYRVRARDRAAQLLALDACQSVAPDSVHGAAHGVRTHGGRCSPTPCCPTACRPMFACAASPRSTNRRARPRVGRGSRITPASRRVAAWCCPTTSRSIRSCPVGTRSATTRRLASRARWSGQDGSSQRLAAGWLRSRVPIAIPQRPRAEVAAPTPLRVRRRTTRRDERVGNTASRSRRRRLRRQCLHRRVDRRTTQRPRSSRRRPPKLSVSCENW